jgi:hypothetical protein
MSAFLAPGRHKLLQGMMTDKESSYLLESASQALASVQGSELVGGRMSGAPGACGTAAAKQERLSSASRTAQFFRENARTSARPQSLDCSSLGRRQDQGLQATHPNERRPSVVSLAGAVNIFEIVHRLCKISKETKLGPSSNADLLLIPSLQLV